VSRERGGRLEREERQLARVQDALKENVNIRQTEELCNARPNIMTAIIWKLIYVSINLSIIISTFSFHFPIHPFSVCFSLSLVCTIAHSLFFSPPLSSDLLLKCWLTPCEVEKWRCRLGSKLNALSPLLSFSNQFIQLPTATICGKSLQSCSISQSLDGNF